MSGVDVDLSNAAREGDLVTVTGLVERGADLDVRDHNGMTPLLQALRYGHADVARLLIERGADLAVTDLSGANARDWAEVLPELIPLLDRRGAVRNQVETIEHPYDESGFGPRTTAFLARLRDGAYLAAADQTVLARLRADMPAVVKALLHTWAHKPASSWIRVGVWELQRHSLRAELPAHAPRPDGVEPERMIVIGVDELGHRLLLTWSEVGSGPVWSYDPQVSEFRAIAPSLERFLGDT